MSTPSKALCLGALLLIAGGLTVRARDRQSPTAKLPLRAVLIAATDATPETLQRIRRADANAVVLNLADGQGRVASASAARVKKAGLALHYWIEVGRNPAMATAHPQWMASLQGHPEWRRHFPKTPQPAAGEIVKNYPWMPVLYREAFDVHVVRVKALLTGLPAADGIFLNDLQAAPSACGCGNTFCRWIPDYGPLRTATELKPDAAAKFVAAVREFARKAEIIPVWTTECEAHESPKGQACHGVPCFDGACWHSWTEQLMPLARECRTLGILAPYRAFQRDEPRYGPTAGWVKHAVASFAEMPPQRKGTAVPPERLVTVLQGWEVTAEQRQAQIDRAREAGARGYVMAEMKIEQAWEPRVIQAQLVGKSTSRADPHPAHH